MPKDKQQAEYEEYCRQLAEEGKPKISFADYKELCKKDQMPETLEENIVSIGSSRPIKHQATEEEYARRIMRAFNMELAILEKNPNCHVELSLSRGAPIKGTFRGLDQRYAKIAVEEDGSTKEITIVRLGYVIAMRIRKAGE
jgi:hypothetical protein